MVEDVDLSAFVNDLQDTISHLEKEEELEKEILEEQKDAENKLADALQRLKEDRYIIRALIYFRKVDMSAAPAEKHQQVEKILDKIPKSGSAGTLQRKYDEVETIVKEIEEAQAELRDVEKKTKKDVKEEEATEKDMEEVHTLIDELQKGASKYREWAKGRD